MKRLLFLFLIVAMAVSSCNLPETPAPPSPDVTELPNNQATEIKSTSPVKDIATDGDELIFTPENVIEKIRYIRVETVDSPSWVVWRDIEIIDAGE